MNASCAAGARLGPYELGPALGAGGMGEVYRARDPRLGRDVAIKILPPEVADDPDRLRRFEQEARAAAALNHPNILSVFDVGADNGVAYLVTELLEGRTLREEMSPDVGRDLQVRHEAGLKPTPDMRLEKAVDYAGQIADGLAAAHARGIVHRDLKPENVFVTTDGRVKILDFGLAKVFEAGPKPTPYVPSEDPTILSPTPTASGVILGTVGYMAPEQIRGQAVDARTDIFAFGCVLYEMLAGRRAFEGDTSVDTLSAILKDTPAPLVGPAPASAIPAQLVRIVGRCLEKLPAARFQSTMDLAFAMKTLQPQSESDSTSSVGAHALARVPPWRRALPWALTLAFAAALVAALVSQPPWRDELPVSRLTLSMSRDNSLAIQNGVAISPDGRTLAFAAGLAGTTRQLYVRRLNEWAPTAVPMTEGAVNPFFSPDGEWIAFLRNDNLEKVRLSGGAPQLLTKATGSNGGRWQPNGTIVFSTWPEVALRQVSADGGAPELIAESKAGSGVWYEWPEPLPDNRGTVFGIREKGKSRIAVLAPGSAEPRELIAAGSHPRYLPSGHLLYSDGGQLRAAAFDIDRLAIRGASVVVMDDVNENRTTRDFDVSATGALVYVPAGSTGVVWRDRNGGTTPVVPQRAQYASPALSVDGTRFSVAIGQGSSRNIWTGLVADGLLTRLTFGNDDVYGVWSRDGARLYYTAGQDGTYNIFSIHTDGSGRAERLTETSRPQQPTSWSPLGDTLLFHEIDPANSADIWEFSTASGKARLVLQTPSNESNARFSPDGRWIAYNSDETGSTEIYVRAYPGPAVKRRISRDGGFMPFWSHTGQELFYQTGTAVFSVPILDPRDLRMGAPVRLFAHSGGRLAISADDQRFLTLEEDASRSTVNVVLNWFQDLKIRMAQK